MEPHISYRIWFAPRTGSTLLCKGLESTGIAGTPLELFNIFDPATLCSTYQVTNYKELKNKLWQAGSTENGVFGVKNALFKTRKDKLFKEIIDLRGIEEKPDLDKEEIWNDLFPNCKHIFLTRRNKVRQAVSWWKAIKDEKWQLDRDAANTTDTTFYKENYDVNALNHLLTETVLHDCQLQEYFSKNNIKPLNIIYEDYILNFEKTIKLIVNFLGLDSTNIQVGPKYFQRTANQQSEEWVQKYRYDLQKNWDKKVW